MNLELTPENTMTLLKIFLVYFVFNGVGFIWSVIVWHYTIILVFFGLVTTGMFLMMLLNHKVTQKSNEELYK